MDIEPDKMNRLVVSWQPLLPFVWSSTTPNLQEGARFQHALAGAFLWLQPELLDYCWWYSLARRDIRVSHVSTGQFGVREISKRELRVL